MDWQGQQRDDRVWNGQEIGDKDRTFPPMEDMSPNIDDYINYNFKFWDVCQQGGHDFVERQDLPPQCAVCGTIYSQEYRDGFAKAGSKHHGYGGRGWRAPAVQRTRKALKRLSNAPWQESTVSAPGANTESHNASILAIQRFESTNLQAQVLAASLLWPIFRMIRHRHNWRPLTSVTDYGNSSSRHYGTYGGGKKEECWRCGETRYL